MTRAIVQVRVFWWGLFAAVLVGLLGTGENLARSNIAENPWHGYKLAQVHVSKAEDYSIVESLSSRVLNEYPGESPMLVLLDAMALDAVASLGYSVSVSHDDIGKVIELERSRIATRGADEDWEDWFDEYKDLDAVNRFLDRLVGDFPNRVGLVEIGETVEGRTIRGLRLGAKEGSPALTFTATQHAREWIAVMTAMCFVDRLVRNPDRIDLYEKVSEKLNIYMFPVVNPDGYEETWNGDRLWRKNKNGMNGVDLNRNWGTGWGKTPGSSGDPFAEDYRGEKAFSEHESSGVRDLILGLDHHLAHFDYHNYSQLVIYPFGFPREPASKEEENRKLAAQMAEAISEVYDKVYEPILGREFLPHAGIVADWVAGDLERVALSIELRPQESNFILPASEIVPTCEENLAGLDVILNWALREIGDDESTDESDESSDDASSDISDAEEEVSESSNDTVEPDVGENESSSDTLESDVENTGSNDSESDDGSIENPLDSDQSGCACRSSDSRSRVSLENLFYLSWIGLVFFSRSYRWFRTPRPLA